MRPTGEYGRKCKRRNRRGNDLLRILVSDITCYSGRKDVKEGLPSKRKLEKVRGCANPG